MVTAHKYTADTLMVQVLDTERLERDLDAGIHERHADKTGITYRLHTRLAMTENPPALFDRECVGYTSEPFELAVYGEQIENGHKVFECIPSFAFSVTLTELQPYVKETKSLRDFMGADYRPEHHRVGANIRSWLQYFNDKPERTSRQNR